jgi:hypothetical protein
MSNYTCIPLEILPDLIRIRNGRQSQIWSHNTAIMYLSQASCLKVFCSFHFCVLWLRGYCMAQTGMVQVVRLSGSLWISSSYEIRYPVARKIT